MARAFTNLEFVLIGRDEYDKLTADHADAAQLRADLEDVRENSARHAEGAAELRRKLDFVDKLARDRLQSMQSFADQRNKARQERDDARVAFRVAQESVDLAQARAATLRKDRDAARAELEQCRALLNAVETIKKTGGAVQIGGVRIEPCDTYGKTDTTRAVDALLDQAEADAQTIDRIIRDRDKARQEAQQALKILGEKLDEAPRWFGLQNPWLTQCPGPV
ncbi:hypothetical protein [Rhodococcus sp. YH1]|uniref:hypothetical protein n=1 Tax=Rhodococcus sp. YH1 TaxID=89066 RepID=UPI001387067F|nr:hypothetical protein [Rhodococcus sp. YH1]